MVGLGAGVLLAVKGEGDDEEVGMDGLGIGLGWASAGLGGSAKLGM
jgi:hypothetical protein